MIQNLHFWENWERELKRKTPVDLLQNIRLLEAMYEEARFLKLFPPRDPLEGLEAKLQMVKVIHVSKTS